MSGTRAALRLGGAAKAKVRIASTGKLPIRTALLRRIISPGSPSVKNVFCAHLYDDIPGPTRDQKATPWSGSRPERRRRAGSDAPPLARARPHRVGAETVVFSCFNQDQSLDRVDFAGLRQRLSQNSVQEKLTKLWVNRCLGRLGLRPELVAR